MNKDENIERIMKNLDIKNKENKYRVKRLARCLEMLSVGIYNDLEFQDNLLIFKNKNNYNATCVNIDGLYFSREILK